MSNPEVAEDRRCSVEVASHPAASRTLKGFLLPHIHVSCSSTSLASLRDLRDNRVVGLVPASWGKCCDSTGSTLIHRPTVHKHSGKTPGDGVLQQAGGFYGKMT